MLRQATGQIITRNTQVVYSVDENRVETVYEGQEPFDVINNNFYKARNSRWQLCNMKQEFEVYKVAPAGTSQLLSEGTYAISEPVLEVIQEWVWTGKQFK